MRYYIAAKRLKRSSNPDKDRITAGVSNVVYNRIHQEMVKRHIPSILYDVSDDTYILDTETECQDAVREICEKAGGDFGLELRVTEAKK